MEDLVAVALEFGAQAIGGGGRIASFASRGPRSICGQGAVLPIFQVLACHDAHSGLLRHAMPFPLECSKSA